MMKRVLYKGRSSLVGRPLVAIAETAGVSLDDLTFHLATRWPRSGRRQAYRDEADPLRLEAEYDAIATGTEPDLSAWVEAVKAIKERYPLPQS
ncbi:hypothetical protein [Pseudomonas aeruginosa]|uniref:hypothetical protein n=1 Tax=Pseudomonas aeruginosa TaxID=287 RepID=UPI001C8DDE8E|nr:hypothetical protein [Pseudomonas aeruginosa]QZH48623.1 hypothetical protein K5A80_23415 [Pseudomonas aeruginosa]